jgi:hypothetical protein
VSDADIVGILSRHHLQNGSEDRPTSTGTAKESFPKGKDGHSITSNEYPYLVLRLGIFGGSTGRLYDVVLRSRNLSNLPNAREVGRHCRRNRVFKLSDLETPIHYFQVSQRTVLKNNLNNIFCNCVNETAK